MKHVVSVQHRKGILCNVGITQLQPPFTEIDNPYPYFYYSVLFCNILPAFTIVDYIGKKMFEVDLCHLNCAYQYTVFQKS